MEERVSRRGVLGMMDSSDGRWRAEVLGRVCLAFLVVTLAVAPVVLALHLGDVLVNLALVVVGAGVYGAGYLLARREKPEIAGALTALTITLCVLTTSWSVGGMSGFLFLGTMTPLLVSLAGDRRWILPVAAVNVVGLAGVVLLGRPLLDGPAARVVFVVSLVFAHACTASVAWLYTTRNTRAWTEVTAGRDRLAVAVERVTAASQAKSAFLANMSHELRTPLNAVVGYSELVADELRDRDPDDPLLADLAKVASSSAHLLALIDDVLDLSKVEAGRLVLEVEEAALDALVASVASAARPLMARGRNVLQVHPGSHGCTLVCDARRVRQILLNLLSNAARFTEQGTVTLTVTAVPDGVLLEVADTGIGIPASALERIFEPFEQAEDSTSRTHGGTGLGLALSRRLAELHGGSLTVRSTPGQGSVFTVWLPG
ncbi:MAG: HAMP domain-containing histidine kinase [Myxococcales bacterium]|nr:HAMP domain-containing histidine kinase [Myxococcales bacterium]